MKRGAERQIQREDGDDPHSVENDSEGASSIDSETRSLASRPIRGLPKKKTGSIASSPAQTLSSSPFSFTNSIATQSNASPSDPAFPNTGSSAFSAFTSAPNTSSSSKFTTKSTPFSFSSPTINGNSSTENPKVEVDYYCSLRGLNLSLKSQLLEAISKEIEKDPFANLSSLLQGVEGKYASLRREAEAKRNQMRKVAPTHVPVPSSSTLPKITPTASPTSDTSKSLADTSAPSFAPPKVHTGGGFTFAGSSFSAPSTSSNPATSQSLLPGQPTFSIPKSGFYSSFGKTTNDDEEDGDDDGEVEDGERDDETGQANEIAKSSAPTFSFSKQSSSLASPFTNFGAPSNANSKNFNFGSASNTPFSFGSAPAASTNSINDASPDKQYRFSFGTSNSPAKTFENEKSTDDSNPSTISTSQSKPPSIGSNFANTSGVKQGGGFSFGSSKISFGNSSNSTFGNTSTGFTFGSSPSKDNNANKEGD